MFHFEILFRHYFYVTVHVHTVHHVTVASNETATSFLMNILAYYTRLIYVGHSGVTWRDKYSIYLRYFEV